MATRNTYTFFKKGKTTTGGITFKFVTSIGAKTKTEALKEFKGKYNTKNGYFYCVTNFGDTYIG